ncbi:MAG TPA: GTPase domain-containing protein [Beijerinckiaceae bacterium]
MLVVARVGDICQHAASWDSAQFKMPNRVAIIAFFSCWGRRFVEIATVQLNLIAILAGIFALSGIVISSEHWRYAFLIAFSACIVLLLYFSMPQFHLHPSRIGSRRLELEELNSLLVPVPKIGLVGKQNVGKTTFLDGAVSRRSEKRQTEKPYARLVAIPDKDPPAYVAVLDTVGQRDLTQFDIQSMSDRLVIFVDHNERDDTSDLDSARLHQQSYFLQQLVAAKNRDDAASRNVIIVLNKADLISRDRHTSLAMIQFVEESRKLLEQSGKYEVVDILVDHSNLRNKDIAVLLHWMAH